MAMQPTCAVCGNSYARAFDVRTAAGEFTFDCFECAIHKLAPSCAHCKCRVIGHGVEVGSTIYCCASCARMHGEGDVVRDRG